MKKIIFFSIARFLAVGSTYAQFGPQTPNKNVLLNASYWEAHPDLAAVKNDIASGNSASEKNQMQFDAAYIAISNGASLDVVKYLIEQSGGDVNKAGHEKLGYMHAAATQGNVDVLNYLISKGAKVDVETDFGMVPIVMAANRGQNNSAVYEAFFKAGINPKQKYANGANLLLLGIANDKDLKLTTYLTAKGLSLKDVDNDGKTAFDYAAKSGDLELLKKLKAKGVKATGNALLVATGGGGRRMGKAVGLDVYEYLVDDLKINPAFTNKDGQNVLDFVVKQQNQDEIINYFLGKGLDINQADNEGNTVFMIAASTKNAALITSLLPKVKNINAVNASGESALTSAVKGGSTETIALLLKNGADIHILDKEGNNLAYSLVQSHRVGRGGFNRGGGNDDLADKLQLLKSIGLNVAAPQKNGSTLYHIAASKNDLVALKALSGLNIDINAKNSEGLTALQKSTLVAKNDEIIKYLLSLGADKSIKTDMGETAYDLAKDNTFLSQNNVSIDFLK